MAKIVSITLRNNDDKWSFGVVRDDNYTERIEEEVGEIENEIERLVEFANSIKTEEQKLIEKVEKDKEELFKVLTNKTTLDERIDIASILPRWEADTEYKIGDERTYNEILYISKKDHTSVIPIVIPINSAKVISIYLSSSFSFIFIFLFFSLILLLLVLLVKLLAWLALL